MGTDWISWLRLVRPVSLVAPGVVSVLPIEFACLSKFLMSCNLQIAKLPEPKRRKNNSLHKSRSHLRRSRLHTALQMVQKLVAELRSDPGQDFCADTRMA